LKSVLKAITVCGLLSGCAVVDLPGNVTYINATEALDNREYKRAYGLLSGLLDRGGFHDAASAQFLLSELYWKGLGTDKDQRKAIELLEAAAMQTKDLKWASLAQHRLGYIFEGANGEYNYIDLTKAAKWHKKAVRLGDINSESALKRLEKYPEVYVTNNLEMFVKPRGSSPGGLSELEALVNSNPVRAMEIAEWHAKSGNADAQFLMAKFFYNGTGTSQNFSQAMRWLWLSAEGGNLDAKYSLAIHHLDGDYVPYDLSKMRRYLEEAANQNHGEALNQLGILAINPVEPGLSVEPRKAADYFEKAISKDNLNALANLGELYFRGIGVQKDEERGLEMLSAAAERGSDYAQKVLSEAQQNQSSTTPVRITERIVRERVIVEKRVDQNPSAEDIFERLSPSVFRVVVGDIQKQKGETKVMSGGSGSAVAITKDIALTNCHVVENMNVVLLKIGTEFGAARVIQRDEKQDVCTLKSLERPLKPVKNSRPYSGLKIGETVYAIGSPAGLENSLSQGVISGKRTMKDGVWIQTTAAISPGSSGGGLFDATGRLIGITTFKSSREDDEALNFAAPAHIHVKRHVK
jgi:TPR repeat protein